MNDGYDYKKAGVDIDAANQSVEMIKKWVDRTKRPEVLSSLGQFGGFFALDPGRYREPVLVSSTDGVGTKLRIAHLTGKHDTVGIDLVAMCVNDILVHGAEPLFFLDYIALGRLIPRVVEELVMGISQGCLDAGCALIGGETAEMPGFYGEDEYDLAGFAVGVAERNGLITGEHISPDDIIIGLPSSGLHSNGYSLARKVVLEKEGLALGHFQAELGHTWGEEMLIPTRIYVRPVLSLLKDIEIKGMAHITGGGLADNLARILPPGLKGEIELSSWDIPPVFSLIQQYGSIHRDEMFRTFNMGIGFLMVAAPEKAEQGIKSLQLAGEKPIIIGKIGSGAEGVIFR